LLTSDALIDRTTAGSKAAPALWLHFSMTASCKAQRIRSDGATIRSAEGYCRQDLQEAICHCCRELPWPPQTLASQPGMFELVSMAALNEMWHVFAIPPTL
jgi:hypothetical protein